MEFTVPKEFAGKTLRQLRQERSEPFRADILAEYLGIDENTPLQEGQTFYIDTPAGIDPSGSAELQFLGASGTSGSSDLITNIVDTLVPQALEFDTEAARAAAEQEWSPYYDELLQDYLAEVGTAKTQESEDLAKYLETLGIRGTRTEEDLATTLDILGGRRSDYMADLARQSPEIQEAIGGGFADRGLFFSGQREEAQRKQLEDETRQAQRYEQEYGYQTGEAQKVAGRTQEDIDKEREARELENRRYLDKIETERKKRERELARQREAAVTGQIETQREEQYYGYS